MECSCTHSEWFPFDDCKALCAPHNQPPTPPAPAAPLMTISFSQHSQTMVTFVIGPDPIKKTFLVHKHLAAASSPFFKAAFENSMVESSI
ncbi:hypothetical protein DL98DRAFT_581057 [Cadophora sp. DSE1049]|nr:hypothetical protein DL98DRAFT_581057 [Cadophora sp. DSE1049]